MGRHSELIIRTLENVLTVGLLCVWRIGCRQQNRSVEDIVTQGASEGLGRAGSWRR